MNVMEKYTITRFTLMKRLLSFQIRLKVLKNLWF
ncbi:hypothetical protein N779_27945 [Vibrio coralliilyticus OCN008]|nr:hypothetical protein N779_27945 [Vibrio coralliilyticus OCN008]